MIIKVTKENIALGVPHATDRCPIALALKRHGFDCPFVNSGFYSYCDDMGVREYREWPTFVRLIINAFDDGKEIKPFSFDTLECKLLDCCPPAPREF